MCIKLCQSLHWICQQGKLSPDNTISLLKSEMEKYKHCLKRTDHYTYIGAILVKQNLIITGYEIILTTVT